MSISYRDSRGFLVCTLYIKTLLKEKNFKRVSTEELNRHIKLYPWNYITIKKLSKIESIYNKKPKQYEELIIHLSKLKRVKFEEK